MHKNSWLGSLAAVAVLAGCSGDASVEKTASNSAEWSGDGVGIGALRGHEDITRFSVEHANTLIQSELGLSSFFPPVTSGDSCISTGNELLKGNCHTDYPADNDEFVTFYGVTASDWQEDPSIQELHYLRNYPGNQLESSKQSCVNVNELIITATKRGLNYWGQNKKTQALYWFGHCLHMIQDSFAPPHTRRSGTNDRVLSDVCTYAKEFPGVCYHAKVESSDRPWSSKLSCYLNPNDRSWGCLVTLAQEAANASTGYLRVVARHIQQNPNADIAPALRDFYSKPTPDNYESYLDCSPLPGPVVYPDAGVIDGGADDSAPDSETTDSATADSATSDSAETDSATVDSATSDGAETDGATVDSATSDGEQIDSGTSDGAEVDGASADGETSDGAEVDGASADSETTEDAQADSAAADSETSDSAQADSATLDTGAADTAALDSAKDSTAADSGKDSAKVDSAIDSGVDSGKPDSAKDSAASDSAKADGADSGQPDPASDDVGESGGCSVSNSRSESSSFAALGFLGLALGFVSRRRQRRN